MQIEMEKNGKSKEIGSLRRRQSSEKNVILESFSSRASLIDSMGGKSSTFRWKTTWRPSITFSHFFSAVDPATESIESLSSVCDLCKRIHLANRTWCFRMRKSQFEYQKILTEKCRQSTATCHGIGSEIERNRNSNKITIIIHKRRRRRSTLRYQWCLGVVGPLERRKTIAERKQSVAKWSADTRCICNSIYVSSNVGPSAEFEYQREIHSFTRFVLKCCLFRFCRRFFSLSR